MEATADINQQTEATEMDQETDTNQEITEILKTIVAKRKGNKMMEDRFPLGKNIFSQSKNPVLRLNKLLEAVPKFLEDMGEKNWSVDKKVGLQQLIIESFCFYFDANLAPTAAGKSKPKHEKVGHESQAQEKVEEITEDASKISLENRTPRTSINSSVEDKLSVVRKILQLRVTLNDTSIWTKIVDVFELRDETIMPQFLGIVDDARNKDGTAIFELLNMCIKDNEFKNHFQPDIILQALLLGELRSSAIEHFHLDRPADFRAKCRDVLRKVYEIAQIYYNDHAKWASVLNKEVKKIPADVPDFQKFSNHVKKLLPELGDEPPSKKNRRIGKKFGGETIQKTVTAFAKKTMNKERYRERVWTVLAQQKDLKENVIEALNKADMDPKMKAAEIGFWSGKDTFNEKNIQQVSDSESEESTAVVQEDTKVLIMPNHLKDKIEFVDNAAKLKFVVETLEAEKKKHEMELEVGVDVEWSAYKSYHTAAIFQLATKEAGVFVIDLEPEAEADKQAVISFLSTFFHDKQVMKIGLNFNEDLKKLRATFPSCKPLYSPELVVNIEQIVEKIALAEYAAKKEKGEKLPKPNSVKNLSELCKDLLGKQLDKAEQDSVWDRRPLRQSQIQYAALDAYCLIELFEKCKESAKKFNLDACEIANHCKCQPVALPLFVIDT